MSKRIQMTCIAHCLVKELWTFEVPDDFNPAEHDPREFWFDDAVETVDAKNLGEPFDETERFDHEWSNDEEG